MKEECPFLILGLDKSADENTINKKWKQLIKTRKSSSSVQVACINDAKEKAIAIAREEREISGHIDELRTHTKDFLESYCHIHHSALSNSTSAMETQLTKETGRTLPFCEPSIGGYYRLVKILKTCCADLREGAENNAHTINKLLEQLEAKCIENKDISKTNEQLVHERNELMREKEAEIAARGKAEQRAAEYLQKLNEMTTTGWALDIERRRAEDAMATLDAECTRAEDALAALDGERRQKDNALKQKAEAEKELAAIQMVLRVEEGEAANDDDQEYRDALSADDARGTMTPSAKKRKYRSVFSFVDYKVINSTPNAGRRRRKRRPREQTWRHPARQWATKPETSRAPKRRMMMHARR